MPHASVFRKFLSPCAVDDYLQLCKYHVLAKSAKRMGFLIELAALLYIARCSVFRGHERQGKKHTASTRKFATNLLLECLKISEFHTVSFRTYTRPPPPSFQIECVIEKTVPCV